MTKMVPSRNSRTAGHPGKAVQIVCKEMYGHDYYLTSEEQMEKEPPEGETQSSTEEW